MEGLSETRPHLEGIATYRFLSTIVFLTLSETRPHLEGIATAAFGWSELEISELVS